MTTTEDNKTIVTEFIQALFTKGDLDAVDDYLAEDFVNNDPPFGATADREGMRSAGALFRSVFPDWRSDLHLLVAEGDIVVEQFTATGTHTGAPIMGVAPSGRDRHLAGHQHLPPARRTDRRALGPARRPRLPCGNSACPTSPDHSVANVGPAHPSGAQRRPVGVAMGR